LFTTLHKAYIRAQKIHQDSKHETGNTLHFVLDACHPIIRFHLLSRLINREVVALHSNSWIERSVALPLDITWITKRTLDAEADGVALGKP